MLCFITLNAYYTPFIQEYQNHYENAIDLPVLVDFCKNGWILEIPTSCFVEAMLYDVRCAIYNFYGKIS